MEGRTIAGYADAGYDLMRELAERGEEGFSEWYGAELGHRVRLMRGLSHLAPGELAGCLGCDVGWIEDVEAGRILPSIPEALALAYSLGVSLAYLLETRPTKVEDYRLASAVWRWREAEAVAEVDRERLANAEREIARLRGKLRDARAESAATV